MLAQIPHRIPGGLRLLNMTVCGRCSDFIRARHVDYGDPRGRVDVDFNIDGRYITLTARITDACAAIAALRDAVQSNDEATIDGITARVRGLIIEVAGANGFRLCCPDLQTMIWLGKALGKLTGQIPSRPGRLDVALRQEQIYRNTVRSLVSMEAEYGPHLPRGQRRPS